LIPALYVGARPGQVCYLSVNSRGATTPNSRRRPGISNRIAAALDGEPADEGRPLALDS
jgi:hypothetical protein